MVLHFCLTKTNENFSLFSLEQVTKKSWHYAEQELSDRTFFLKATYMLALAALSGINCAYESLKFTLKVGPALAKWGFDNIPLIKKAGLGKKISQNLKRKHINDHLYKATNCALEILLLPTYGVICPDVVIKRHMNIFYPTIPLKNRIIQKINAYGKVIQTPPHPSNSCGDHDWD